MIVGCKIELFLPQSRSLKAKRQVLKSLKDRIRNRFNVSIAEVDHQDLGQRGTFRSLVRLVLGDFDGTPSISEGCRSY